MTVAKQPEQPDLKKYACDLCSYIYDPARGDHSNGVEPGTTFDQLPEHWTCPECGAGKKWFRPVG